MTFSFTVSRLLSFVPAPLRSFSIQVLLNSGVCQIKESFFQRRFSFVSDLFLPGIILNEESIWIVGLCKAECEILTSNIFFRSYLQVEVAFLTHPVKQELSTYPPYLGTIYRPNSLTWGRGGGIWTLVLYKLRCVWLFQRANVEKENICIGVMVSSICGTWHRSCQLYG